MKVKCPDCDAVYNISDYKIKGPAAKAVCRKCGAKIEINSPPGDTTKQAAPSERKPEDTGLAPEPTPPEPRLPGARPKSKLAQYSVVSLSPKYPKYRDPLIILTVVLILVGLLAGVHLAVQGTKSSLDRFFQDPVQYVAKLVFGTDKMKLCTSFLDRNENRLAILGKDFRYFPIKEETRVSNGRETSTIIIRVQGTQATKDVIFGLEERNGDWEIVGVILDLGRGQQQTLYP